MKSTLTIFIIGLSSILSTIPAQANPAKMVLGKETFVRPNYAAAAGSIYNSEALAMCETTQVGTQVATTTGSSHTTSETHKKGGGGGGISILKIVDLKGNGSKDTTTKTSSQSQSSEHNATPVLGHSCNSIVSSGADLLKTIHTNEAQTAINVDNNYTMRYQIDSNERLQSKELGILRQVKLKELDNLKTQMQLQLRQSVKGSMFGN